MDSFWQWIIDNYQWVISIAVSFLGVLIVIFKRFIRIKYVDDLSNVLLYLPVFIKEAEASGQDGKSKFAYVMTKAVNMLVASTSKSTDQVINEYGSTLNKEIENILSCPQKKGD